MPKSNGEKLVDPLKLVAGVSEDTMDSFFNSFYADPKMTQALLGRVTRHNPRLAQRLLIESQRTETDSPENAHTRGAMLILGLLVAEDDGRARQIYNELIASPELQPLTGLDFDSIDHGPLEAA